jgi:hypothetical protein
VYGGGGIMPDIFIPMDTIKVSTIIGSFLEIIFLINLCCVI